MNKSKTKKLALLTTVVILVLCFIPAVQAAKSSYKRPILDWAINNWSLGGWATDTRIVYPDFWIGGLEEYEYSGYIIEKILKDGSFLLTVNLVVKDIGVLIYDSEMVLLLMGSANLNYQMVFHLDADIPGNDWAWTQDGWIFVVPGTRTSVDIIPWWITMIVSGDIIGAQVLRSHVVMAGEGECTGEGGYEVGPATFTVNQIWMGNKAFPLDHPIMEPWGFWPIELIEIHQS